jgi:hypothetical protein
MGDLSEHIFDIKEESKQQVFQELIASGKWTEEELKAQPFKFWRRRCECVIPDKDILKGRLEAWWQKWKDHKIDDQGRPLFMEGAADVHANHIKLVESGALTGVWVGTNYIRLMNCRSVAPAYLYHCRYLACTGCVKEETAYPFLVHTLHPAWATLCR